MDDFYQVDGIGRAQDGSWYSYGYDVCAGRVMRIWYFDHQGDKTPVDQWFLPPAA